MDIEGTKAYLTIDEQERSGLMSPLDLIACDAVTHLGAIESRLLHLESMQAADDDELTHSERASIAPELDRAQTQRRIYSRIASELLIRGLVSVSEVIDHI